MNEMQVELERTLQALRASWSSPNYIVSGRGYAIINAAVAGLRERQVVEIVHMFPGKNMVVFGTSVGRLTDPLPQHYATPEAGKFRMLADFGPFKEGDVVVTFDEGGSSENVEVYNFQGKHAVVPVRFMQWIGR